LWVRFSGIPGGDISILNVYASTSARERCAVWKELIVTLPRDCWCILSRDWNFVERQEDKSSLNGKIISMGESCIFSLLKDGLEVSDQFLENEWATELLVGQQKRRRGLTSLHRYCYFQIDWSRPIVSSGTRHSGRL